MRATPPKRPLSHPLDREQLVRGIKAMEPALRHLANHPDAAGLEPDVLNHVRPHLLARANELAKLA